MNDSVLDELTGFEQVVHFSDPASGLDGVIAIHSTGLGPALGGLRFAPYPSRADALHDALRLARGMTYKAAMAGLDLGGGKAVINGDPRRIGSERLLRAFGRVVESLGGRYITAEDVGTTEEHMLTVRRETSHVVGLPRRHGGLGDPSPMTALGVLTAMKAAARVVFGTDDLGGRRVAVSGLGKVGGSLARMLVEQGATVLVGDIDAERVEAAKADLGVTAVEVDAVHRAEVDILAPCALGGYLTEERIEELRAQVVCGAANNQLADPSCAERLRKHDIAYVPDFVANAGGLIQVAAELAAETPEASVRDDVLRLGPRVEAILRHAVERDVSTNEAAEALAKDRILSVIGLRGYALPAELVRAAHR